MHSETASQQEDLVKPITPLQNNEMGPSELDASQVPDGPNYDTQLKLDCFVDSFESQDSSKVMRGNSIHLIGCADVSETPPTSFGFWATRFMELFGYCPRSQVLVALIYQETAGEADRFVEEMCARGLSIGHANFLFDMIESIAVDVDSMESIE